MAKDFKRKSLKCIEWIFHESPQYNTTVDSETFLLQDCKCNIRFHSGDLGGHARFYFIVNGDLQLPLTVTLRVTLNSEDISHQKRIITFADQEIWDYPAARIVSRFLTFEIIFHTASLITGECFIKLFSKVR